MSEEKEFEMTPEIEAEVAELLAEIEWNDQANDWLESLLDAVQNLLDSDKYYGAEVDLIANLIDVGSEAGYINWNCDCEPGECQNPEECNGQNED